MQLPYLVRAVISHASDLANEVIAELRISPETPAISLLTDEQLRWRVLDVYSNLGQWIEARAEPETRETYRHLGRRRCEEGIPAAEMVYGLLATKRRLTEFIRRNAMVDTVSELFQLEELFGAINHFFDVAVYNAVQGHESARRSGLWNATPVRGARGRYPGAIGVGGAGRAAQGAGGL
jgi:hypothetical protein